MNTNIRSDKWTHFWLSVTTLIFIANFYLYVSNLQILLLSSSSIKNLFWSPNCHEFYVQGIQEFLLFFITCGKTCGVPPPSLGAASLCVFLLFLDSTAHDGVPAPGTHGNDSVLHRLYIFKSKQECETRDFTLWYVHVKVHSGTFLTVSVSPGVAHAWGTVLPLSVPLMSPLSWPLSFLVSFLVPTGIIIPGFRVVYYWGPGRRHTSRHGWRISSLGWGRKGQSGDLGSAFPETNFAQIYNNKDFYSCGQHVLTDRNRRSWVESSEVLCV